MSAGAFAGWAIDALVASALLLAAVLLIRGPVRRAFGPGVAYLLWVLPSLRLVLPPLPSAWREATVTPITRAGETLTILIVEPARHAAAAPVSAGLPAAPLLLALGWAAGAALFLGYHLVRHRQFCRRVLRGGEVVERVGRIAVVTSDAAAGPLAFGIWQPYVAFPRDFADRYDADERSLALAHELGHHQRGDLLANWLALAVLAVHWFNPLAWYAFRAFRADQELANDARVLAGRAPQLRHAYGRAIVKAACGGAVSPACHLHPISDLKGRLKMLARSPTSRRRLVSGGTTVVALVIAGLGLTASGSGAAAISGGIREAVQAAPAATSADASMAAVDSATAVRDSATADRDSAIAAADSATAAADSANTVATSLNAAKHSTSLSSDGRKVKRIVIVKDGKATTYVGADADRYVAEHALPVPPVPPVPGAPAVVFANKLGDEDGKSYVYRIVTPDIRSQQCAGDDTRQAVEHRTKGGRDQIIICTNRIEAMSRDAQRLALNTDLIERSARGSARASLSMARAAIEGDRNLSDAQRSEALAGIAKAEAELSADND